MHKVQSMRNLPAVDDRSDSPKSREMPWRHRACTPIGVGHSRSTSNVLRAPKILLVFVVSVLILAACSSKASTQRARTTTTRPAAALCPLTGAPVPGGGAVPKRPALAIKVDNYPAARPQSGLNKADIVFEEPVEGAITRYVAVFQCQQGGLVGPIRSARNIDIGILGEFGSPLLVHVGGINPVLANINNSPLVNIDLMVHGAVEQHPPGRYAPYDTYATTTSLWNLKPNDTTVPAPVFKYSRQTPAGTPATTVAIPFSGTSNVVWKYNPALGVYQRYYGVTPDVLANGQQNSAANVVVQFVHIYYGPWLENSEGGLEVQANLYQSASGNAEIFRNGVEIAGTWQRNGLGVPTQFLNAQGQTITLNPGTTWVELVPDTIKVTATGPAPTSSSTSTNATSGSNYRG